MEITFTIGSASFAASVKRDGDDWAVSGIAGADRVSDVRMVGESTIEFCYASGPAPRTVRMPFIRTASGIDFSFGGNVYSVSSDTLKGSTASRARPPGSLRAPMFGVVADVLVGVGERVAAHDPLMVLEAMKVMATIEAPFDGVVTKIHFGKGDVVPHGDVVLDIEKSG